MSRTSWHEQHTEYPSLQIPSAGINAGLGGKPSQAQQGLFVPMSVKAVLSYAERRLFPDIIHRLFLLVQHATGIQV